MKHHQILLANPYYHLVSIFFILVTISFLPYSVITQNTKMLIGNKDNILESEFNQESQIPITTQSKFKEVVTRKKLPIKFTKHIIYDNNLAFGNIIVSNKGKDGYQLIETRTIFYDDNTTYSQESKLIEAVEPSNETIIVGRKKEYGTIKTEGGEFQYFAKLKVYATSYDKNCKGCNETTALGLKTGFGVIAVDPLVIPLGSKLYVPGYGIGIAGDTGGLIKGQIIDLGFDDVKNSRWSARYTDVYLLAN